MATTLPGSFYPPVGFHFVVTFLDFKMAPESGFQSVSGLSVEYETESFKEGGENRFEHTLPVRTKYPDLVLKRGMLVGSQVVKWCMDALQDRQFKPTNLSISLLNDKHLPLCTWQVNNAWPKKWTVSDFNAVENSIVLETLELSYTYFKIIKP